MNTQPRSENMRQKQVLETAISAFEDMVQEFVEFTLTTIPVQPYSNIIKEDWRGDNSELSYLMDNLQSLHEYCEKIPKEKKTEIIDYMKNLQSLANGGI